MKFGGSSVGSIDLIKNIAAKIAALKAEDDRLILVVSAMAKTTDELWNMAHMISQRPRRREMDMLLTAGRYFYEFDELCIAGAWAELYLLYRFAKWHHHGQSHGNARIKT